MGSDDNRETREQIIKLFQCQVEKNAQCQIVPIWSDSVVSILLERRSVNSMKMLLSSKDDVKVKSCFQKTLSP